MNVPAPRRDVMIPIACSVRSPERREGRLTPIFCGQLALGRQAVAGAEAAGHELAPDVLDDLRAGCRVARSLDWSDLWGLRLPRPLTNTTRGLPTSTDPAIGTGVAVGGWSDHYDRRPSRGGRGRRRAYAGRGAVACAPAAPPSGKRK